MKIIKTFIFILICTLIIISVVLGFISFSVKISLYISHSGSLFVIDFVNFYISKNNFISFLVFENTFATYGILVDHVFFLLFKYCLLASIAPNVKWATILIFVFWYVQCLFPWLLLSFSLYTWFQKFDVIFLCVYFLCRVHWASGIIEFLVFLELGKVCPSFLRIFFHSNCSF